MSHTVASIAEMLNCSYEGRGDLEIESCSGLREAECGQMACLFNPKYTSLASTTKASAVIVSEDWEGVCQAALIRSKKPEEDFTKVAMAFAPPDVEYEAGIHPTAIIHESAQLGEDLHIGPYVIIEAGAVIGDRCVLMNGVFVGEGVQIGADCRFYPKVALREYVELGHRVWVHNGAVIGSEGFGYSVDDEGVRTKIPQIGTVLLGNDVEVGANTCIDRARFGATRIGNGVKIDNLVMIAHNCVIRDHAVLISQSGIAGSTLVGARAILAGQSGVAGHLEVGEAAIVGAQAGVTKDVSPGTYVIDFPATPFDKASLSHAHVARLPKLKKRVDSLEERLSRLESKS